LSWGGESNLPTDLAAVEFWIEPAHFAWPGLIIQRGEQKFLIKPDGLGGVTQEQVP
jgi:hypothetical protein